MDSIRVAIIGAGIIGTLYGRIIQDLFGVDVIAVHDINPSSADALAQELNANGYSEKNYKTLFARHPDLDAALICTSQEHHLAPTLAAIEAGVHVQIEKPLAANFEQAVEIVETVSEADIISMVNLSLRFDPRYVGMRKAILNGDIGRIRYLCARRNPPFMGLGSRIKPGVEELPFWVGVHDIDMIRWITRSEVLSVYATSTSIGFEETGFTGAILTNITLKNGVIAVLENAWREITPDSSRLLSSAAFRAHGTNGTIEIRSDQGGLKIIQNGITHSPDVINMPKISDQITGTYRNQTEHFFRCLRENVPTGVPLLEGLYGVMAAEAIIKSIRENRIVYLDEEYPLILPTI
jgi:predicted dehydrogenase